MSRPLTGSIRQREALVRHPSVAKGSTQRRQERFVTEHEARPGSIGPLPPYRLEQPIPDPVRRPRPQRGRCASPADQPRYRVGGERLDGGRL